jgi:hypothetical protein
MADATNWVGSRLLLRRLRDVMAGADDAQSRLDQVVTIIARDMVAEVCSIYLLRPGDILELFATEGLLKTAVHRTRLRVGEGARCRWTKPRIIRNSPTGRRPVRKSTIPSSACRSCAAAGCAAC